MKIGRYTLSRRDMAGASIAGVLLFGAAGALAENIIVRIHIKAEAKRIALEQRFSLATDYISCVNRVARKEPAVAAYATQDIPTNVGGVIHVVSRRDFNDDRGRLFDRHTFTALFYPDKGANTVRFETARGQRLGEVGFPRDKTVSREFSRCQQG